MSIAITVPADETAAPPDTLLAEAVKATKDAQAEVERLDAEAGALTASIAALQETADAETANALDGDSKKYDRALAGIAEAKARVELLTRASRLAAQKLDEAKAAQLRAASASMVKQVDRICKARAKAAADFTAAIETAAKALQVLDAKNDLLNTSWPVGVIPEGVITTPGLTRHHLAVEMYRIAGRLDFPGALSRFDYADQPEKLRSFATSIDMANEYAVRLLKGEAVKPASAAPEPEAAPALVRADQIARPVSRTVIDPKGRAS